jgi:hypothetical protein
MDLFESIENLPIEPDLQFPKNEIPRNTQPNVNRAYEKKRMSAKKKQSNLSLSPFPRPLLIQPDHLEEAKRTAAAIGSVSGQAQP